MSARIAWIEAEPRAALSLLPLVRALAEAIETEHGERAAVLEPGSEDSHPLEARVEQLEREGTSWILICASHAHPDLSRALREKIARRVRLIDGAQDRAASPRAVETQGAPLLRTVLLRGPAPSLRAEPSRFSEVIARGARRALRGSEEHARVLSYESLRAEGECVRLRVDALGPLEVPHARRSKPARESLARWARAATGRSVGVALGGAGSWGYAGAALLLELEDAGVPIDRVAGSSSGALLGAFHCVAGRAGLERAVKCGPVIGRAIGFMALSSAPAQWLLEEELNGARLEELETALLPVVSNLEALRPEVIAEGSVGLAVRASVSAPGVFAPTLIDGVRYVDGAAADNVPAALLEQTGSSLVIAANCLPASASRGSNIMHGRFERSNETGNILHTPEEGRKVDRAKSLRELLEGLDPLRRLDDARRSIELTAHLAGLREATPRRLYYAPDPVAHPLRATFAYGQAERVLDHARRHDRRLRETVEAARAAWRELSAPRASMAAPSSSASLSSASSLSSSSSSSQSPSSQTLPELSA